MNEKHPATRPDPCGYRVGNAVCRLPKRHLLSGIVHQLEPAERESKEYVPLGPIGAVRIPLDGETLGRIAYEAYQGLHAGELSEAVRQNAPSKKPVPTGGRIAWKMLDAATKATWIRVGKAVSAASKQS